MSEIKTFGAADLARRTGDVLDAASRRPVAISKHRKPRFVLMSMERYEAMRGPRFEDQRAFSVDDMPDDHRALLIEALEKQLSGEDASDDT